MQGERSYHRNSVKWYTMYESNILNVRKQVTDQGRDPKIFIILISACERPDIFFYNDLFTSYYDDSAICKSVTV